MADVSNSIPVPARPLLRIIAAAGHRPPAHLPVKLDPESEFVMLIALRDQTSARLDELTDQLWTAYVLPPTPLQCMPVADAAQVALPRSGLVQAQPGVLLFKGGRTDA